MKTLEPTDLAFFDRAPLRIAASAHFTASPARVFEALADPASWVHWFPLMYRAEWTGSTAPGVGAERDVALRALGRFRERMIAWEPGVRYAFTMVQSTSPLAEQLAEDYALHTDGNGTRMDWVMAAKPTSLGGKVEPGLVWMMKTIFARAGRSLEAQLSKG